MVSNTNKMKKAIIIDVRSPEEFMAGHVAGSINIPLNEIPGRVEEFKLKNEEIIFCCASGNRSGQATAFLKQFGVNCSNGGSWLDVNETIRP